MNSNYDVIIIGGGAAGIMAAISTKNHHPEYSVAILDRTFALGRKILVCGAGRCNITNINLDASVEGHYYGASSEFIKLIFSQFSYKDIVNFFNDLGIELYVERKTDIGKLFPITDSAKTVTALLEDELQRLGIDVYLNTEVSGVSPVKSLRSTGQVSDNRFQVIANLLDQTSQKVIESKIYNSKYLIISAGGKTYPALGSNGTGYTLIENFGHSIITPVPSALPLVSKNKLSHALQGVKMDIEVTSIIDGKEIKTRSDDVMFTQYGFSGPAILNISREISIRINRENNPGNVKVKLNFFPGKTKEEVKDMFGKRWNKRSDQTLEKSMFGLFPNKIPSVLLNIIGLDKDRKVGDLNSQEIENFINNLSGHIVNIDSTRGWNEAEFTAGGIDTTEVKESTLQSKNVANLYFCGEILDVDGDVGGFNLSWAWSSGHVAGKLA